ncbi:Hypothetical_protein [Hexamita inflata]|uniref:Hypothetical_protein n=1 Tax=Hexamita inflata TaxID=28002 RepID=A0AA86UFT3_9EUKA|nr:Hypothetical protein HINF_LOCUS41789 [Hexamita inflata]
MLKQLKRTQPIKQLLKYHNIEVEDDEDQQIAAKFIDFNSTPHDIIPQSSPRKIFQQHNVSISRALFEPTPQKKRKLVSPSLETQCTLNLNTAMSPLYIADLQDSMVASLHQPEERTVQLEKILTFKKRVQSPISVSVIQPAKTLTKPTLIELEKIKEQQKQKEISDKFISELTQSVKKWEMINNKKLECRLEDMGFGKKIVKKFEKKLFL